MALSGHPCWGVNWSSVTRYLQLYFGPPSLRIEAPDPKADFPASRHRRVFVVGQRCLMVNNAYWKLSAVDAETVTGASTENRILRVLTLLDGQQLTEVAIDPGTGATRFGFDLGASLSVRRKAVDQLDDLWYLLEPDGYCVAVNGRGQFSHQQCSSREDRWRPLANLPPTELTVHMSH